MSILLRTALLAVLTLGLSSAHAQASELIGSWEFVSFGTDTDNVIALRPTLTFGADGTLTMHFAAPVTPFPAPPPGTYSVEGDTVTASFGEAEQPARFWFEKGDLYIDDGTDVIQLRRKSGC